MLGKFGHTTQPGMFSAITTVLLEVLFLNPGPTAAVVGGNVLTS